jgi:hypothetical protein
MKTPILFILFNRLDTTQQVFEAIRVYQPEQLYIAADGPRLEKEGEKEQCDSVREWVLSHIDWECDIKTLFQSENLGCGKGPATAISWFFNHEEEGIILEDDCVPHRDFFEYAAILLEKYRDDKDIMAINSSNFQTQKRSDGSYYFSMQNGPFCAWATWKRAWKWFDFDLTKYSEKQIVKSLKCYKTTKREKAWWINIYKGVKENIYNGSSWDYQFIFAIWAARGKSIAPNVNLSSNIGFGPEATHTTDSNCVTANRETENILPIVFPSKTLICREADLYYHDFYYDKFVEHISFFKKIKRFIKRLIITPIRH